MTSAVNFTDTGTLEGELQNRMAKYGQVVAQ